MNQSTLKLFNKALRRRWKEAFWQCWREAFLEGEIQGRRDAARECEARKSPDKLPAYNTACDECAIFNAAAAERLQILRASDNE